MAMMLPRSKTRSVTSSLAMPLVVMTVVMALGGELGCYVEKGHHEKMDVATPSNFSFNQKMMHMGSRGCNSKQVQHTCSPADEMCD